MNVEERLIAVMTAHPTLTGCGLGKVLRGEGFSADQVSEALLDKGFTVQREDAGWGIVLHVSRRPLEAGLKAVLALMGDSGEVAWHKQP